MKIVQIPLLTILIICCSISSYSQYYYYNDNYYDNDLVFELGGGVGVMDCITDVGGANSDKKLYFNEIRPKNSKLSTTVFLGAMYKNFLGVRLDATWGQVGAKDADITSTATLNLKTKTNRNLNFRSSISEIALLAEFHPLMLHYFEDGPPRFSPYIVGGVGRFSFNPQAEYKGHWIDLKNLHTEGQGFKEYKNMHPYNTTQMNIPLGVGVRYELSSLLYVRLEFLHRILFTDYLDDASSKKYINPAFFAKYLSPIEAAYATALYNPSKNGLLPARRGNPNNNDAYMTMSLKIGIALGRQRIR